MIIYIWTKVEFEKSELIQTVPFLWSHGLRVYCLFIKCSRVYNLCGVFHICFRVVLVSLAIWILCLGVRSSPYILISNLNGWTLSYGFSISSSVISYFYSSIGRWIQHIQSGQDGAKKDIMDTVLKITFTNELYSCWSSIIYYVASSKYLMDMYAFTGCKSARLRGIIFLSTGETHIYYIIDPVNRHQYQ